MMEFTKQTVGVCKKMFGISTMLLACCTAMTVQAAPADMAFLKQVNQAAQRLSYSGVISDYTGNQLTTLNMVHAADTQGEYFKTTQLDGTALAYLDDGQLVSQYDATTQTLNQVPKSIQIAPIFPHLFYPQFEQLGQFYDLVQDKSESGIDRVAERACQRYTLMPKNADRYRYELCVDTQTQLLLRLKVIDNKQQIVDTVGFVTLKLDSTVSRAELTIAKDWTVKNKTSQPARVALPLKDSLGYWHYQPTEGYVIQAVNELKGSVAPVKSPPDFTKQVVLSDGLTAVSVMISPFKGKSTSSHSKEQYYTDGALNVYQRQLAEHQIELIGNAPFSLLKKIADQLSYQKSN